MEIKQGRMVHLGYGKYWRSDEIVGLCPIEENRGPGRRTEVFVSTREDSLVVSRSEQSILSDMASLPDNEFEAEEARSLLNEFLEDLQDVNPVLRRMLENEVRVDLGENPANALWLWGGGTAEALGPLRAQSRPDGLVLSRGRTARAVANLTGMSYLEHKDPFAEEPEPQVVPVVALVEALRGRDLILVHVPSPHEMGGYGDATRKVRALDRLDINLLAPLKTVLDAYRPYRLALLPDGAVSSDTGLPLADALPVLLAGEGIEPDEVDRWDEPACAGGGLGSMDIEHFSQILWDA